MQHEKEGGDELRDEADDEAQLYDQLEHAQVVSHVMERAALRANEDPYQQIRRKR